MKTIPRRHGFTLVEMSIVVIILGLLVGSILSGRALMRASELNSIAVSYQVYKNAVKSFRVQYYSLPGDMANATSIWGYTGGAGCTNSSGTASTSPGTCDGDGDGFIEYGATASRAGEAFQGWRQLALGSFIDGSYTGIAGTPADGTYGAVKYDIGTNGPNSKIDLVGWSLSYFDNSAGGTAAVYAVNYLNWFVVGTDDGTFTDGAFLTAEEAWGIDTKIDDGLPGSGSVNSWPRCSVANSNSNFTSAYDVGTTTVNCPLIMKQASETNPRRD